MTSLPDSADTLTRDEIVPWLPSGAPDYVLLEQPKALDAVLEQLGSDGVLRVSMKMGLRAYKSKDGQPK